ncbi:MAG: DUF883 family protein [Akkermansiaceae bacterium]
MDETLTNPVLTPSDANSIDTPSQQAADDLRAAASGKAQQIKETAVNKAQQFREYAGTKATDIKETAKVKAQHFKEAANEQVLTGKVKAREMHSETEEYIRQNPTKSVLTALGIGFAIGLLIRR